MAQYAAHWRCTSCAFDNPASLLRCDICGCERPAAFLPGSVSRRLLQEDEQTATQSTTQFQTFSQSDISGAPSAPASFVIREEEVTRTGESAEHRKATRLGGARASGAGNSGRQRPVHSRGDGAELRAPSVLAKEICQQPQPCPRKDVSPGLAAYCDRGPSHGEAATLASWPGPETSSFPRNGFTAPGTTISDRSSSAEGRGRGTGAAPPLESKQRQEGRQDADGALPDFLGALYGLRLVDTEPFLFDSPSPDDQVRAAQSKGLLRPTKQPPAAVPSRSRPSAKAAPSVRSTPLSAAQPGPSASPALAQNGQERASGAAQEQNPALLAREGPDGGVAADVAPSTSAKGRSMEEYREEKWIAEAAARAQGGKPTVHVLMMGHVDAGKSTLTGHLLHDLGLVSAKEMHRSRREAEEQGKGSFAFAWVLDEGREERQRGVTMTVGLAALDTPRLHVCLMDAPGHRDFVPSMISGAAQADAAVLVVDASPGALEAGLGGGTEKQQQHLGSGRAAGQDHGQTWEHCQLARSCGVDQLIVAVNKMDAVGYSQAVFESIKGKLAPILRHTGFKTSSQRLVFVPVSGTEGENLTKGPQCEALRAWYTGPSFLEALDSLAPPARDLRHPLRVPIAEVLPKSRTLGPTAVSGKIESGGLKTGQKVLIMPMGISATAKAIESPGGAKGIKEAVAGCAVDVGLTGVEAGGLFPGTVLCHPEFPVPAVRKLQARILTLELKVPILRGTAVTLHVHCATEPAVVSHLEALLDPKTGRVTKQRPRVLPSSASALVQISLERPVCVDLYSRMKSLGCIALRGGGRTLAVGIVTELLPDL